MYSVTIAQNQDLCLMQKLREIKGTKNTIPINKYLEQNTASRFATPVVSVHILNTKDRFKSSRECRLNNICANSIPAKTPLDFIRSNAVHRI